MADQTVSVDSDSKYRVAFDLMKSVMQNASDAKANTEDEMLNLYVRCRLAVISGSVR